MHPAWPALPYERWTRPATRSTPTPRCWASWRCALAPPEPELQHAALRLTARGWETLPLPAPNGSGAFVVALDLHRHLAVVEHSDGRSERVPLAPDRPVGEVTREVLAAVATRGRAGRDRPHAAGDALEDAARRGHRARDLRPGPGRRLLRGGDAGRAVLAALRAPYRGRSTPVNAWWGSFDLAVSLYSGRPADPPSRDFIFRNAMDAQEIAVGWWPGDPRYPRAAFYAYAHPAPDGLRGRRPVAAGSPLGRRRSASTCSTGTTRAPPTTRMRRRSSSPARSSATPAASATGTRRSRRASRATRRPVG